MAHHYLFGLAVLVAAVVTGVTSKPANNDVNLQYLPFYGGAKGQYLEIRTDNSGAITSEKIVTEDKMSTALKKKIPEVVPEVPETSEDGILLANLARTKATVNGITRLVNMGRVLGTLGANEKTRLKDLMEIFTISASNCLKVIHDVNDDVNKLFRRQLVKNGEHDDYIEEEGVGIEAPVDNDTQVPLGGTTIAEAKPVGLAVIGENGLAASRPVATAVASTGIALARPIATAVAGVDPASLGINFQVSQITH